MKHFTSVTDVPDLEHLLDLAQDIKARPHQFPTLGTGKTLGLIFFNSSLRTRLSTQKAAINLGLPTIVMNIGSDGWKLEFEDGAVMNLDRAEHIKDAAAVIGSYCDIIGVRAFAGLKDRELDYQEHIIEAFKTYAGVPIVSLESATRHPLQSLADLITIRNHFPTGRPRVVLSWAPHPKALPQAVGNSFLEWMKAADMDLTVTHPEGYELADSFSAGVQIEYDQQKAFEGADIVYAKNWSSYQEYGQVLSQDLNWTITAEKMKLSNQAKFMHCLPVRRNVIVADAVIDSPHSLVLEQASNRVVSAQLVLQELLKQM